MEDAAASRAAAAIHVSASGSEERGQWEFRGGQTTELVASASAGSFVWTLAQPVGPTASAAFADACRP